WTWKIEHSPVPVLQKALRYLPVVPSGVQKGWLPLLITRDIENLAPPFTTEVSNGQQLRSRTVLFFHCCGRGCSCLPTTSGSSPSSVTRSRKAASRRHRG